MLFTTQGRSSKLGPVTGADAGLYVLGAGLGDGNFHGVICVLNGGGWP